MKISKSQIQEIVTEEVKSVLSEQSMTRQHFKLIADVLKDSKPTLGVETEQYWKSLVETFASALTQTNPRFNKGAFMKAAGY
jgi:hypothetical protein